LDAVSRQPVLELGAHGLYRATGNFYIDSQRRVEHAVITRPHADLARTACGASLRNVMETKPGIIIATP
jgi:hypothetical protein